MHRTSVNMLIYAERMFITHYLLLISSVHNKEIIFSVVTLSIIGFK